MGSAQSAKNKSLAFYEHKIPVIFKVSFNTFVSPELFELSPVFGA